VLSPINSQIDQRQNPLSISPVDAEALRHVIFLKSIDRGEVIVQNDPRSPVRGSI
jgi:hypothetical protein